MTIYKTVFSWRGGITVAVLLGALLAFAIFAWDKASGLSVEERREIGVLKAIGWKTSDVLLLKCWEGAVIPILSFMAGLLLAYVHVFCASSVLFEPVLKGWAVFYPRFSPVPFIDAGQVAVLFFLTVVPYSVGRCHPFVEGCNGRPGFGNEVSVDAKRNGLRSRNLNPKLQTILMV